jgi:hypothetical protein
VCASLRKCTRYIFYVKSTTVLTTFVIEVLCADTLFVKTMFESSHEMRAGNLGPVFQILLW